ncbi:TPA: polysaccharide deacetylase family protein [Streptococcus suis]
MRKLSFWLGVNIVLLVIAIALAFWLVDGLKANQLSQFIEQKQHSLLTNSKGKVQVGNIDTTHVVATFPTDDSGQAIPHVENKMYSYIEKRLGRKKPAGKIKKLVFVSSKDGHTNFNNVKAKEIQAEHYEVANLQIKKIEDQTSERILLTQDNQLFTLGIFLNDLSLAGQIIASKLEENLFNQGKSAEEIEAVLSQFEVLDLNSLTFGYADSQLTLYLPDATFGLESLTLPISDFFQIVQSDYLVESDKVAYNEFMGVKEDKSHLRQIALTFDDGPNPATTPIVLDLLKKYNAKATFFVLGHAVAGNEAILQRMVAEGHEVANHSWSHPKLTALSSEEVRLEIESTQQAVEAAIGQRPKLVRPPYGAVNQAVVDAMGLPSIYWNVDTEDWLSHDVYAINEKVRMQACPGCIILMHDIHQSTVDSLEPVLQFLTSEGYNLVTTSELLGPNLNPQFIYYNQEWAGPAQY